MALTRRGTETPDEATAKRSHVPFDQNNSTLSLYPETPSERYNREKSQDVWKAKATEIDILTTSREIYADREALRKLMHVKGHLVEQFLLGAQREEIVSLLQRVRGDRHCGLVMHFREDVQLHAKLWMFGFAEDEVICPSIYTLFFAHMSVSELSACPQTLLDALRLRGSHDAYHFARLDLENLSTQIFSSKHAADFEYDEQSDAQWLRMQAAQDPCNYVEGPWNTDTAWDDEFDGRARVDHNIFWVHRNMVKELLIQQSTILKTFLHCADLFAAKANVQSVEIARLDIYAIEHSMLDTLKEQPYWRSQMILSQSPTTTALDLLHRLAQDTKQSIIDELHCVRSDIPSWKQQYVTCQEQQRRRESYWEAGGIVAAESNPGTEATSLLVWYAHKLDDLHLHIRLADGLETIQRISDDGGQVPTPDALQSLRSLQHDLELESVRLFEHLCKHGQIKTTYCDCHCPPCRINRGVHAEPLTNSERQPLASEKDDLRLLHISAGFVRHYLMRGQPADQQYLPALMLFFLHQLARISRSTRSPHHNIPKAIADRLWLCVTYLSQMSNTIFASRKHAVQHRRDYYSDVTSARGPSGLTAFITQMRKQWKQSKSKDTLLSFLGLIDSRRAAKRSNVLPDCLHQALITAWDDILLQSDAPWSHIVTPELRQSLLDRPRDTVDSAAEQEAVHRQVAEAQRRQARRLNSKHMGFTARFESLDLQNRSVDETSGTIRRLKPKTRGTADPTRQEQNVPNIVRAEAQIVAEQLYHVDERAMLVFQYIFPGHKEAPSASLECRELVHAFLNLGLIPDKPGNSPGSSRRFVASQRPDDHLPMLYPFTTHFHRGDNGHLELGEAKSIGRRLNRKYGWTISNFSTEDGFVARPMIQ